MDGAGNQLLAGAALSLDQHGRNRIRGVRDLFVDREHAGRPADDPFRRDVRTHVRFGGRRITRERTRDGRAHFGDVERLADVVKRTGAHGLHGGVERPEAADQDDLASGVRLLERFQHIEPRLRSIQVDVGNHEVEVFLVREVHRLRRGLALLQLAVWRRDELGDQAARFHVIVDDQNTGSDAVMRPRRPIRQRAARS